MNIDVDSEIYADKVKGCWLGKNAGGTLGAPLEQARGQAEPFDVWWYPKLEEGGIPNDDLEMQLVWLQALQEVGPGLSAADLTRYWLDHVGYNFDEYGLSKTNLRLGLTPPVSGSFNNWFVDCMGCPIRSEIWACVAPGNPRVAAWYAYQDAICDHAGGESVYGELFHVAVEAAAFVEDDRDRLIAIGLSYLPESSKTATAIHTVLEAHGEGIDWLGARARVLQAVPHYNAQYSPINLGFEMIGWLYGEDFGDALCKTVNCGYDTDSSGAAIGAILGIVAGASGLPQRWVAPLGETIATNASWGGLRNVPALPASLDELTPLIREQAKRVLAWHATSDRHGDAALEAGETVRALWRRSPQQVTWDNPSVEATVDYLDGPAVRPGSTKRFRVGLANPSADPTVVTATVITPAGWPGGQSQSVQVGAKQQEWLDWEIDVPGRDALVESNRVLVALDVQGRPQPPALPVVLVGAWAARACGPYPLQGSDNLEALNRSQPPEEPSGDLNDPAGRPGDWRELAVAGNELPVASILTEPGVAYLQTFVDCPQAQDVWLGAEANCPVAVWANSHCVLVAPEGHPVRPNYAGDDLHYVTVNLVKGWNELLLKLVWDGTSPRPECFLLLSSADTFHNGLVAVGRTRLPWDRTD